MVVHGAAPLVLVAVPSLWLWAVAALAGSHAVMAVFGMWPSSQLLGRTVVRLPEWRARAGEVALTFDDGPDPAVTPAVLDILDRHGARASFFLIGRRAAAQPDLVREIVRRGHQVESHTWGHRPWFACLGLGALRYEVERAQEVLTGLAGRAPRFVRAPLGLRTPLLDPVLHRAGLIHVSWTRRGLDGVSRDAPRVLARLLRGLRAGDVLLLHDGGSRTVLDVLPGLLRDMDERGLRAVALDAFAGPATAAAAGSRPAPAACASP